MIGFHRGQTTLEMLLVLLVLIPLFFGAWELARGISVRMALDSGTDLAARALSMNPADTAYAGEIILDQVNGSALCPSCGAQVQWCVSVNDGACVSNPGSGAIPTTFGTKFYVKAWLLFQSEVPLVALPQVTIAAAHLGRVEYWP